MNLLTDSIWTRMLALLARRIVGTVDTTEAVASGVTLSWLLFLVSLPLPFSMKSCTTLLQIRLRLLAVLHDDGH